MRLALVFLSIFILQGTCFAQDIQQEITALLKQNRIDEAEARVEAYLADDPKNVDALVMKGNVIYKRYITQEFDHLIVSGNENESIYDESMGYMGAPPVMLTRDKANEINGIWLRAADLDPSRIDIHFGICQVYSTAMMKNELIRYLKTVKEHSDGVEDMPYLMAEYARNLKERRREKDAIDVYLAISRLYPEHGGILSDIATEYYLNGEIYLADQFVQKALTKGGLDEMVYSNAFFISSIIGNYDLAQEAVREEALLQGHKRDILFQGLVEMERDQKNWRKTLRLFVEATEARDEYRSLGKLLSESDFEFTDESLKLVVQMPMPDHYKMPVYEAFMKRNPTSFESWFQFAEALTYHGNYMKATDIYRDTPMQKITAEQKERFHFYHAWTLYKNEEEEDAFTEWEPLLKSENFYYKSAAAYFSAKFELSEGNIPEARELFESVSERASESKYAMYCKNLLEAM